ncbi:MarR family winged helix-turn-helix transcriptional regulator [Prescottella agglutinans]|uniref:DNA-binding MarR family transcriptional regulator n=1 Tax=Prescottella agglutinans TaxID=1644129 RepID=A0ABT6MHJ6_9NOCA|nr:MarR family transcriptional regulator [Prescottella agglutinans]MDH6283788.1 DNA-binding MarR family transcriptional regulator [Prescottella agglutinans]
MAPGANPEPSPNLDQATRQLRRYDLLGTIDPQSILVAVRLLAAGGQLSQASESHFGRFGLSTGRYRLLADLEDSGGEKSPSQLAESLGVSRATVTGLVNGLERDGYALRRPSDEDGRAASVVLTARGASMLREIAPDHFGRLNEMVSALTPKERTTFLDLLGRIVEGIPALTAH